MRLVFKQTQVVVEAGFELMFRHSDDHQWSPVAVTIGGQASSIKWAVGRFAAVVFVFRGDVIGFLDFRIVLPANAGHVSHVAVTNFCVSTVKHFVECALCGNVCQLIGETVFLHWFLRSCCKLRSCCYWFLRSCSSYQIWK